MTRLKQKAPAKPVEETVRLDSSRKNPGETTWERSLESDQSEGVGKHQIRKQRYITAEGLGPGCSEKVRGQTH